MTLRVIYVACITSLSLLAIYDLYWGIITFKYRRKAEDENTSFCKYMFRLTDLDKWKNREDSITNKFYNSRGYSVCYLIMSVIALTLVCFFVMFLIRMGNSELGSQLLDLDLLMK